MSIVSERERKLVLDLLLNRISESEFSAQFPLEPGEASARGLSLLERGREAHDPVAVEFGLYLGHRFGVTPAYLDVLCALAGDDWHERHESVIDALAKLKSPASVDVFYRVALAHFPYRDYDEARSLGVKCIWALGTIQTRNALESLARISRSGEEILADEAKKQLERIERAGSSGEARARARSLLQARLPD